MPENILLNQGLLNADYDNQAVDFITTEVETVLVDGIIANKTANKAVWLNGLLTYTVELTNGAEYDLENLVFTDKIDTTKATLVADTVMIDGVAATYTFVGDLLTVELPNLAVGEDVAITFQVQKV